MFCYIREIRAEINTLNARNINNTALHCAADSGSVNIIKLLLDKGMSVNLSNKDGFTQLHVCAKFGHLETTKLWLKEVLL
jgi:ankyrin